MREALGFSNDGEPTTKGNMQLTEEQERDAAERLVRVLGLRPHHTDSAGSTRYQLNHGYADKTALGVYRVIRGIFEELDARGRYLLPDEVTE